MADFTNSEIFESMGAPALKERNRVTVKLSRPERATDSEGGSMETLGNFIEFNCDPILQDDKYGLSVMASVDIRVGDILLIDN